MKKSFTTLALMSAFAVTGCYGPFNLTRKLHDWNGKVGDRSTQGKWVNEAVFLGLNILPVYTFALLGDAIVFNSIEFWTGNNPVKLSRRVSNGDASAVISYAPDARRLRVDSFEKGRPTSTVVLEPGDQGMVARGADGRLLASAATEGASVVLRDAAGKEIGRK